MAWSAPQNYTVGGMFPSPYHPIGGVRPSAGWRAPKDWMFCSGCAGPIPKVEARVIGAVSHHTPDCPVILGTQAPRNDEEAADAFDDRVARYAKGKD